jgi:hypothetical protein
MRRAGHVGLLPHDFAFRAESGDLDLKLRRRGADVDRDFLSLSNAALTGVAFDEKRDGIGGVERGDGEEEGESAAHGRATRWRCGRFQRSRGQVVVKAVKKAPA